jgi:hypothetical protein
MIGTPLPLEFGRDRIARSVICVCVAVALGACSLVMPEPLPFPVDMGEPDMRIPMKPDLFLPTAGAPVGELGSPLTLAGAEAGAAAGAAAGIED